MEKNVCLYFHMFIAKKMYPLKISESLKEFEIECASHNLIT